MFVPDRSDTRINNWTRCAERYVHEHFLQAEAAKPAPSCIERSTLACPPAELYARPVRDPAPIRACSAYNGTVYSTTLAQGVNPAAFSILHFLDASSFAAGFSIQATLGDEVELHLATTTSEPASAVQRFVVEMTARIASAGACPAVGDTISVNVELACDGESTRLREGKLTWNARAEYL